MIRETKIEPFDPQNKKHLKALSLWWNDLQNRHLHIKFHSEKQAQAQFPKEELAQFWQNSSDQEKRNQFVVNLKETPVSHLTIRHKKQRRKNKQVLVSILSIVIGNKKLHRQGLGRHLMKYLEKVAKSQGAHVTQVRVFEFNTVALQFYKKLGYQQVRRKRASAWWNSQMWDVLVLEKNLAPSKTKL